MRLLASIVALCALAIAAPARAADACSTSAALDALDDAFALPLAGSVSASFRLESGTLAATLTPEVTFDKSGGGTWVATAFSTPTAGVNTIASTLVLTNPSSATQRSIFVPAGAMWVRVKVTAHTSGTATGVICVSNAPGIVQIVGSPSGPAVPISGTVTATDGSGPLTVDGTVTVGTFPDNEPINVAQMNGVAVSMGNGGVGTGVQRVTIANDSTGVVGLVAGSANIGDVDIDTAPQAATADTEATAQAADFTVEAATANLRMLGYTAKETAGATARIVIRHDADGTCDSTAVLEYVNLNANETRSEWWPDRGKAAASGVCVDVISGTVSFNAFFVTEAAP